MNIVKSVIAIAVVLSGLGLWLEIQDDSPSGEKEMSCGISMMTDKPSYAVGEPIIMTLRIFNYTKEQVIFHFNSAQRYDFIIEDAEGNEIWRWSRGKVFAMVLGEEILGPDCPEITYAAEYKGKLSPGCYKISGILVAIDRPMTATVTILVG